MLHGSVGYCIDRLDVAWIGWILHGSVGCCMDRLVVGWIG